MLPGLCPAPPGCPGPCHSTQAVAQAWVWVGTGCDSPGDGYLQPLELLAAEEALASSLEEDYLLGYQLVALLLQPGHHARLQEHLTASRGRCAPRRGSETPAGSSRAQRWGTWLPAPFRTGPCSLHPCLFSALLRHQHPARQGAASPRSFSFGTRHFSHVLRG